MAALSWRAAAVLGAALVLASPASAQDAAKLRWTVDAQWVVDSNITTHCAASAKARARRVDPSRLLYDVRLTPVPADAPESVDVRIIVGEAGGSPGPGGACGAIARVAIPVRGATVDVSGMRFRIRLVDAAAE
ncbi:hypothetical protein [Dolichospermum phage Dfl-JY45]